MEHLRQVSCHFIAWVLCILHTAQRNGSPPPLVLQCWGKLHLRGKGIKFAYQAPDNPGKGLKPGHVTLEGKGEGLELQVLCRGLLQDGEGGQAHGQERGRGHGVGQEQPVLQQQGQQAGGHQPGPAAFQGDSGNAENREKQ